MAMNNNHHYFDFLSMEIEIKEAYQDIENLKQLFTEYTNSLNIDLSYQNYKSEFSNLPGKYTPPNGRLYIAYANCKIAGCIALRKITESSAEIKRLYVRPQFRQYGIGQKLVQQIIAEAKQENYQKLFLDTLDTMEKALKLYQKLGFKQVPPYYNSPIKNTVYFCLELK